MPKIVGKAERVVDIAGVLSIDEYVGNVGSQQDDLSIALVKIIQPNSEPWLTLDYDEWMVVLKGYLEIHYEEQVENCSTKQVLTVKEGETVFIPKGERFQPVFPQAGAEYLPVCIPAFRPDRCLREEEVGGVNTSEVAENLANLHLKAAAGGFTNTDDAALRCINSSTKVTSANTKIVYHMCQQSLWEKAVESGKAYFPPTFQQDGFFTHATAVPARLLETANHFYTATEGFWICLELSVERLQDIGIMTLFEEPKPVGDQTVSDNWQTNHMAFPHIYGGIPVSVDGIVSKTFDMKRDAAGNFVSIVGLTDGSTSS
jgi:uncharacterized protein (DUF952 family)/mannose-6-phosphate isomerase-like protein (cupin superfamily)